MLYQRADDQQAAQYVRQLTLLCAFLNIVFVNYPPVERDERDIRKDPK